jgi:hypothetical protein
MNLLLVAAFVVAIYSMVEAPLWVLLTTTAVTMMFILWSVYANEKS